MTRSSLLFSLLTLLTLAFASSHQGAKDIVASLVSALNTKDEAKIREFVTASMDSGVPVQTRVERLKDFADQGAPFKVVKEISFTETEAKVVIEDKMGTLLGFNLALSGGKIKGLRIGPPSSVEGASAYITDWTDLKDLAQKIVTKAKAPAMSISVIRDGKSESAAVGQRVVGKSDPVGPDETWSIGSIGKPLCTTIIALLIEQGKLRWDETLMEALPGVPMKPGYEKTTLEQIMHHRGGIPQDLGFNKARVDALKGNETKPEAMRARYAKDILSRDPIAAPDTRFAYSNAGYALLGHIAERVTGKPYEQLVHDLIFKPLGLKHSFTGGDRLPAQRPTGHILENGQLRPMNMTGPLEFLVAPAGGGMYMSTADLAKFGVEHLKGLQGKNGLLKASTVQRLHQGVAENPNESSFAYACGWGIESNPGVETFHGHNGSNGTFRAQLAIFPKSNMVVAAITNAGGETEPSPGLEAALALGARYAKK